MISGKFPFGCAHQSDKKYKLLMQQKYNEYWKPFERYSYFSPECKEVLQKMFEYDPAKRILLHEIAETDWFNDYVEHSPEEFRAA